MYLARQGSGMSRWVVLLLLLLLDSYSYPYSYSYSYPMPRASRYMRGDSRARSCRVLRALRIQAPLFTP